MEAQIRDKKTTERQQSLKFLWSSIGKEYTFKMLRQWFLLSFTWIKSSDGEISLVTPFSFELTISNLRYSLDANQFKMITSKCSMKLKFLWYNCLKFFRSLSPTLALVRACVMPYGKLETPSIRRTFCGTTLCLSGLRVWHITGDSSTTRTLEESVCVGTKWVFIKSAIWLQFSASADNIM